MNKLLTRAFLVAGVMFPGVALAQSDGAVGGAIAGGAAGAVVGGPVGAAVGAGAGGVAGSAATRRDRDEVVIEHEASTKGCSTVTTEQSNSRGDSVTKQRSDC
ncbi:MAG: hypothetical protein JWM36_1024 [Hyphomicrobiales bacterium]|nr:hypothetical protein [Hyphomicrobiales bacterium]